MLTAKKMIECFEHLSFFVVLYKHHVEFTIILTQVSQVLK